MVLGAHVSRSAEHLRRIAGGCCLLVTASACTYGYVTDSQSGDPIGGATVSFDALKVSESHKSATTFSGTSKAVKTWSASDPNSGGHDGLYYLNPNGQKNDGDTTSVSVAAGWQRVKISKSGFDTAIFYRDHQYSDTCETYGSLPYPDAKYPINLEASKPTGAKTICVQQDFSLSPNTSNYEKQPDILVDPRSLNDNQIATNGDCKYKDDNGKEKQYSKCLRMSVGTPNVGAGDLHVLGELNFWGRVINVRQRVYKRNSGYVDREIPSDFTYEDALGHKHFHFMNWTKLRLRKYDAACPTQGWSGCPELKTGRKISFCLEDIYTFESGIATGKKYNCEVESGSRDISQGISVGMQDVYAKSVYGQVIDISGLAAGTYWLEAEVNPEHIMTERDYSNNTARVTVQIP